MTKGFPWAPECPKVKNWKWSVSQPGIESLFVLSVKWVATKRPSIIAKLIKFAVLAPTGTVFADRSKIWHCCCCLWFIGFGSSARNWIKWYSTPWVSTVSWQICWFAEYCDIIDNGVYKVAQENEITAAFDISLQTSSKCLYRVVQFFDDFNAVTSWTHVPCLFSLTLLTKSGAPRRERDLQTGAGSADDQSGRRLRRSIL